MVLQMDEGKVTLTKNYKNHYIQSYTQGTAQNLPLSLVLQNVFCQPYLDSSNHKNT